MDSSDKDLPSSFPPSTSVAAASSAVAIPTVTMSAHRPAVHITASRMSSITIYHYTTVYTVGLFCVVGYYRSPLILSCSQFLIALVSSVISVVSLPSHSLS